MEMLRKALGIDRWTVFGGSWGSTLAMAYAQAHPERCRALILRGIFLFRKSELDWFLYGIRNVFPEAWRDFVAPIPEAERGDLLTAYYKRLTDPDPAVHIPAARAWSVYDCTCSTLLPNPEAVATFADERLALGLSRITAHYFVHDLRGPHNDLVAGLDRIRHIPTIIIQGRYDMVCPPVNADELAQNWPEAEYHVVADAGHSAMEPGICAQLLAATEKVKTLP
jgi:proline iminopeptidase